MSFSAPNYDDWLQKDIAMFRERVLNDPLGVMDADGLHHEFVSGMHGQKLDFDKIVTGTDFYFQWVALYARAIRQIYGDTLPDMIVGIANGANRLASSIGSLFDGQILVLQTEKVDAKTVRLTEESLQRLKSSSIKSALIVEDVGTTGSTTVTAVADLRKNGIENIVALNGWIRTPSLTRLDEIDIVYHTLVHDTLPVFSPGDCKNKSDGFCARNFTFVPHSK